MNSTEMPQFEALVDTRSEHLQIKWTLHNTLSEPIVVFDLLRDASNNIDRRLCYYLVEGWEPYPPDAAQLVVTKGVLSLEGVSIYVPDVPLGRELKPSETLRDEIQRTFPQHRYAPHKGFSVGLKRIVCGSVGMRLGFARRSRLASALCKEVVVDGERYCDPKFPDVLEVQEFAESPLVPCQLTLKLRKFD